MGFITKVDFTRQVKQFSGSTATLSGSTHFKESISASTIFSGSTNLYDIFVTAAGSTTSVQGGKNISTGGTATVPIVNLKDDISVNSLSGTSITATTISAATISAATFYSGSTLLQSLLGGGSGEINTASNIGTGNAHVFKQKSGVDLQLRSFSAGTNIDFVTGDTIVISAKTRVDSFSATTLSASTFYSGSSNIDTLFIHKGIYNNIWVDAGAMVGSTLSGATSNTEEYTGSSIYTQNIMSDHYSFTATTAQTVQFRISMSDDWDRGTIKSKIYWDPDAGASLNDGVVWGVSAGALSNSDVLSGETILGTEVTINDQVIAPKTLHITSASTSITIGGNPALEDLIIFQIARKVDDSNDNMTKNAKLLGCNLQYKEMLSSGATQW